MARRDPAKPGLADLERHRAAFEAGGITSPEIATALGVSPQKVNAAIKRDGWCRPVAKALSGGPAKGTVTTFTTAEAGDLLTSFAIATLARAHALVTDGDLGPSALKAVSAAAEAAEGILQRLSSGTGPTSPMLRPRARPPTPARPMPLRPPSSPSSRRSRPAASPPWPALPQR